MLGMRTTNYENFLFLFSFFMFLPAIRKKEKEKKIINRKMGQKVIFFRDSPLTPLTPLCADFANSTAAY